MYSRMSAWRPQLIRQIVLILKVLDRMYRSFTCGTFSMNLPKDVHERTLKDVQSFFSFCRFNFVRKFLERFAFSMVTPRVEGVRL